MKYGLTFVCLTLLTGTAAPVYADQATAKEVARINNCPPKKIEIYQQSLGAEGKTIYRVECNMPKTVGDQPAGADALLISCRDSLCEVLHPIMEEQKK